MVLHKYKLSSFGETRRLTGVEEHLIELLLFMEKLYVFNEEGKRIGRFSLRIDREEESSSDLKILYVHISNCARVDGRLSESIVTGTVTPKLKTLEEIRYECTEVAESGKHERYLFLLKETTKYYLSVTNKICDVKTQVHYSISFVEALGLIGESANAVLLRSLAIKGYEGILCMKTILSNGKRCRNYYVTKLSEQMVNGKLMQVLVVYRNLTNHKKCNVTMTMALTRAGQLIYLFWSNSKYFLHVDPDANIETNRYAYGSPNLDTYWHKDVQLYSMYLDRADQRKIMGRSYKYQNEALKRIVGDFVEFVLFNKPADVICFAIKYFTAFGHDFRATCPSREFATSEHNIGFDEVEKETEDEKNDFGESFFYGEA